MPRHPTPDRSSPARRRAVALAAIGVLVGLGALAGCGSSGRELRDVPAGQTAPPRSTVTTVAAAPPATVAGLALLPDGWTSGGPLPTSASCDGAGISPGLQITGVPAGTAELAVVVTDPDAEGFVHWIVTGLAPTDATLVAGAPLAATELTTSAGSAGWAPLCPPSGESHVYELELLALPGPPTITDPGDPSATVAELRQQATTRSLLTGTYGR